jgi:trehalose/maltose transport system substrate-binding protein
LALGGGIIAVAIMAGCTAAPDPEPTTTVDPFTEHGPIAFAVASDSSGAWAAAIAEWNRGHRDQPVTLRELPSDSDQRHNTLADAAKAGRGEFTVMALDSAWVPEFAGNGWISELPTTDFATDGLVPSAASGGTFQGRRYGFGITADAGVLYYRKDLLDKAKTGAPKTWDQLVSVCAKVRARQPAMSCLGMALAPTDQTTVNTAEAVYSAGGTLVEESGTPAVSSSHAVAGVNWLAGALADGTIPQAARGWGDDEAVQAFADGKLVFLRSGTTAWRDSQAMTNASQIIGKVAAARIPGEADYGTPVSGGYQLAIATKGRNQGTAADFMRWLASEPAQRILLSTGSLAPSRESLYADAQIAAQQPYLSVFAESIAAARSLPRTEKYPEFSKDVAAAVEPVLSGTTSTEDALAKLQQQLTDLLG